jgi:hypothetical protein
VKCFPRTVQAYGVGLYMIGSTQRIRTRTPKLQTRATTTRTPRFVAQRLWVSLMCLFEFLRSFKEKEAESEAPSPMGDPDGSLSLFSLDLAR